MCDHEPGLSGSAILIQIVSYGVVLTSLLTCTLACDSGAAMRSRAVRDAIIAATEERAAEAVEAAESEARTTLARTEALQNARESIALALDEGREAMARRKRVEQGLQHLHAKLPAPDLSAKTRCERLHYPCSVSDVPSEIMQRSSNLSDEVDRRIERGDDVDEVVEWLLTQHDIIDIQAEGPTIAFRLRGGWPMRMQYTRLGAGRPDPQQP